jgi:hypothetical protein
MAESGQDPLIYNQMVDVPKRAEFGLSGGLSRVTGHPVGTRSISKGAQAIKV